MTATTTTTSTTTTRTHRRGAPLLPPVLAYTVLALATVVVPLLISGQGGWTSDAALAHVYQDTPIAARLSALLILAASAPFAVFTAVFSSRIRQAGVNVPGRLILLVGGTLAAACLALSGMIQLALTGPHVADDMGILRFGQGLSTALGGTAFAVFTGLLVSGVAVPGWLGGLLPKGLAIAGVVLAVVCELGVLTTLTSTLGPLLPIARFGSMIWLIAAAATLRPTATRRPRRVTARETVAA